MPFGPGAKRLQLVVCFEDFAALVLQSVQLSVVFGDEPRYASHERYGAIAAF